MCGKCDTCPKDGNILEVVWAQMMMKIQYVKERLIRKFI